MSWQGLTELACLRSAILLGRISFSDAGEKTLGLAMCRNSTQEGVVDPVSAILSRIGNEHRKLVKADRHSVVDVVWAHMFCPVSKYLETLRVCFRPHPLTSLLQDTTHCSAVYFDWQQLLQVFSRRLFLVIFSENHFFKLDISGGFEAGRFWSQHKEDCSRFARMLNSPPFLHRSIGARVFIIFPLQIKERKKPLEEANSQLSHTVLSSSPPQTVKSHEFGTSLFGDDTSDLRNICAVFSDMV